MELNYRKMCIVLRTIKPVEWFVCMKPKHLIYVVVEGYPISEVQSAIRHVMEKWCISNWLSLRWSTLNIDPFKRTWFPLDLQVVLIKINKSK